MNGKKAKTTGAMPPRKMDEDNLELDLTQVNMDIKAGVNLEAAVIGSNCNGKH